MNDIQKFNKYKQNIQSEYNYDISNYKQSIQGGNSTKKRIIDYNLNQLLLGIKIQKQHTTKIQTALQIAMDHLQQIPDYYDRLIEMQKTYQNNIKQKQPQIKQNYKNFKMFKQIVNQILQQQEDQCNIG